MLALLRRLVGTSLSYVENITKVGLAIFAIYFHAALEKIELQYKLIVKDNNLELLMSYKTVLVRIKEVKKVLNIKGFLVIGVEIVRHHFYKVVLFYFTTACDIIIYYIIYQYVYRNIKRFYITNSSVFKTGLQYSQALIVKHIFAHFYSKVVIFGHYRGFITNF